MKTLRSIGLLIACVATVLAIGWLDYITGREISLGFFYLLLIIGITFKVGRRGGFAVALLCVVVRIAVDRYSGRVFPDFSIFVWNTGLRLLTYLTVAYLAGHMYKNRRVVPLRKKVIKSDDADDADALIPYENRLSIANKAGRLLWTIVWMLLFRMTPEFLNAWRAFLLRCFGARIGRRCKIDPSLHVWAPWNLAIGNDCRIEYQVECYSIDSIVIGNRVVVGRHAYLCGASHDPDDIRLQLTHAPIQIADDAWIGAKAFIRPGITVGKGGVVTACAVVTRDVEPWTIVAGSPGRFVRKRELAAAGKSSPEANDGAVTQAGKGQA